MQDNIFLFVLMVGYYLVYSALFKQFNLKLFFYGTFVGLFVLLAHKLNAMSHLMIGELIFTFYLLIIKKVDIEKIILYLLFIPIILLIPLFFKIDFHQDHSWSTLLILALLVLNFSLLLTDIADDRIAEYWGINLIMFYEISRNIFNTPYFVILLSLLVLCLLTVLYANINRIFFMQILFIPLLIIVFRHEKILFSNSLYLLGIVYYLVYRVVRDYVNSDLWWSLSLLLFIIPTSDIVHFINSIWWIQDTYSFSLILIFFFLWLITKFTLLEKNFFKLNYNWNNNWDSIKLVFLVIIYFFNGMFL